MSTGHKPQSLGVPDDLREALDGNHIALPIDMIQILDRMRDIDENAMAEMLSSIENVGLINPIQVREALDENKKSTHYLIAGRQRLEAYRRKFMAAHEMPEGPERDKALGRWSRIPAIVYSKVMTTDQADLLEVIENLDRRDLTKAERQKWAAKKAELLARVRPREVSKTREVSKVSTWIPPTMRARAEALEIPFQTFMKWYRDFKTANHGKDWNKQTEAEHAAFQKWLKEAPIREAAEKAKKEEEAKAKCRDERIEVARKVNAALLKDFGDLALLEAIEKAGGGHLLGGNDGR